MDLTLTDFVVAVLLGSGGLVVLGTLLSRVLQARAESRALARRTVCRLCLHVFQSAAEDRIVKCPACGAANERGRCRHLG